MPWLRLDDQFSTNAKILSAGKDGRELYFSALGHAARNLTDGFIAAGLVRQIAAMFEVYEPDPAVARLVEVGLWDPCDGGWRIHDYLQYNPSRAQVLAEREAAARRQAAWRSQHQRDQSGQYEAPADAPRNAVSNAVTNGVTNTDPVPVPVPNLITTTTTTARAPEGRQVEQDPDVAHLFTQIERAGIVLGGQMQAEQWRAILDVTRDHGLIQEAFEEAAKQPRQPNVRYVRAILERSIAEGRRPGDRPRGNGRSRDAPGAYVPGQDADMAEYTRIALAPFMKGGET